MKPFRRSGIAFPLVAIITALALPAQAEDRKGPPSNAPPGRPVAQAAHPGSGHPQPMQGQKQHQAQHQRPHNAHVAHRPVPSRHFAGRAYHGQVAWQGGRWHHERRHGRYGWWWDVGGASYFYPQPIEGPPAYVSDVEIIDDPYDYPPPVA